MGINLSTLNPENLRVYGNAGGMLPQKNSASRPNDLTQVAILLNIGNDGKFNNDDYLLFYGEGADRYFFDSGRTIFFYERNLYSAKNYYYITIQSGSGKRIATENISPGSYPVINRYHDFWYHELDEVSVLASGREWYGERFNGGGGTDLEVSISGILSDAPVKLVSDVVAQAYGAKATFAISLNGAPMLTQEIPSFVESTYGFKGKHKRDTASVQGSLLGVSGQSKHTLSYQYTKSGIGTGFVDFALLSFERSLMLYGNQTLFNSSKSTAPISTFQVGGATASTSVWDITNIYEPVLQQSIHENAQLSFEAKTNSLRSFVAFSAALTPELVGYVPNQDLRGANTPDMIIVSHPDFIGEAERLAAHREQYNGWSVLVTTPEKIYNEFSSGRQDVSAIRDFAKHVYDKDAGKLKAVLLMGKGSHDYMDRLHDNTNFVPTYESRNSLEPLETYSSDDFFGLLGAEDGEWAEGSGDDETMEVGVGRLPVKSVDEARIVVDKIIHYDENAKRFGGWRKDIIFVADDGNNTDKFTRQHQINANVLANDIEMLTPEFNTRKIFLGTYSKVVMPNGEVIPQANQDIQREFYRGALIVNYTGHGSEHVWADEKILTDSDIGTLENHRYPFLVTATCEFGRQDKPDEISSAELTLLKKNGGAIGLVTTSRPVYSENNQYLNEAFYTALFKRQDGLYRPLGDVFKDTKNNSGIGVGNRNFSLMGDPGMRLALPSLPILVKSVQTQDGDDVLKALSKVVAKGIVTDMSGDTLKTFNGIVECILFDKETDFVTIGKNNPAFSFKQWSNALYRGQATVQDGVFQIEFILPKSIAYEIGQGKMSLYAYDKQSAKDAAGVSESFQIGGSQSNPGSDNTPPVVTLFIGDTTFVAGGITTPNTTLVVKLQDDSGINVSNYGIGNNMIGILDGGEPFAISDYYSTDIDTYQSGWVHYPLRNLSPGNHTLTVKVWDTHNNPAQASIDFIVTEDGRLVVENFGNYPNPFENATTLFFHHNRSGDDLEGELYIYDLTGQQIKSYSFHHEESSYEVKLLEFDTFAAFGKKLPGGLYLARLTVRSLTNGSKTERVAKLIVLN